MSRTCPNGSGRRDSPTSGDTAPTASSRPIRATASPPAKGTTAASSATWSAPCTGPASGSSSTWSSTTRPRAASAGRYSTSRASPTRPSTAWTRWTSRIHLDFTGCGNTVNANHPLVTRFIVDCLEYWVREMHVDGFRFDLASAMARDEAGLPMHNPPVLWAIELSDVLARTKIIAEAWDAAGLYQVGSFPGYRLDGVERTLPRQRAPLRARGSRDGRRRWPPGCPAAAICTSATCASPSTASTSSPATTASRSTTW